MRSTSDVVELKVAARVWFWGEIGMEGVGEVHPSLYRGVGGVQWKFKLDIKSEFG
jgi:hypothetical protein